MFGMGLTEILLVGVVILLLFSPKELPGMIKNVARIYGSLRRTAEDFRSQVMEAEELREPFDEIRDAYTGTRAEIAKAQGAARRELAKARLEARMAEQRLSRLAREAAPPAKVDAAANAGSPPPKLAAGDDPSSANAAPAHASPAHASPAAAATPAAVPSAAATTPAEQATPSFAPPGVRPSAAPNKRAGGDDPDERGAA